MKICFKRFKAVLILCFNKVLLLSQKIMYQIRPFKLLSIDVVFINILEIENIKIFLILYNFFYFYFYSINQFIIFPIGDLIVIVYRDIIIIIIHYSLLNLISIFLVAIKAALYHRAFSLQFLIFFQRNYIIRNNSYLMSPIGII